MVTLCILTTFYTSRFAQLADWSLLCVWFFIFLALCDTRGSGCRSHKDSSAGAGWRGNVSSTSWVCLFFCFVMFEKQMNLQGRRILRGKVLLLILKLMQFRTGLFNWLTCMFYLSYTKGVWKCSFFYNHYLKYCGRITLPTLLNQKLVSLILDFLILVKFYVLKIGL